MVQPQFVKCPETRKVERTSGRRFRDRLLRLVLLDSEGSNLGRDPSEMRKQGFDGAILQRAFSHMNSCLARLHTVQHRPYDQSIFLYDGGELQWRGHHKAPGLYELHTGRQRCCSNIDEDGL